MKYRQFCQFDKLIENRVSFPHGSASSKESACNARDVVPIPRLGSLPWRKEWLHTPVFWPGEFQGDHKKSMGSQRVESPWGHKELKGTFTFTFIENRVRFCA